MDRKLTPSPLSTSRDKLLRLPAHALKPSDPDGRRTRFSCVFVDAELEAAYRESVFVQTAAITTGLLALAVAVGVATAVGMTTSGWGQPAPSELISEKTGGGIVVFCAGSSLLLRVALLSAEDQRWASVVWAAGETSTLFVGVFALILLQRSAPDTILGPSTIGIPLIFPIVPHTGGMNPWHQMVRIGLYTCYICSRIATLWGSPSFWSSVWTPAYHMTALLCGHLLGCCIGVVLRRNFFLVHQRERAAQAAIAQAEQLQRKLCELQAGGA